MTKLCGEAFEAVWQRAVPHEDYRPVCWQAGTRRR
ncbi:hypothetical protein [Nonomuraea jiangxiensis]